MDSVFHIRTIDSMGRAMYEESLERMRIVEEARREIIKAEPKKRRNKKERNKRKMQKASRHKNR